ncbi:MAG: DUF4293 domain-containing protein [Filimonas sp.]|nr:DUF4293 domain-containing protein [Filimonas sp.]
MIQRVQTIWLLLASVCGFITLNTSFYTGIPKVLPTPPPAILLTDINAKYNVILLVLTVAIALASLIAIFLYKDRKMQLKISIAALIASLGCVAFYFKLVQDFTTGRYTLTSAIVFAIPVLLFFAVRNIYRDEKLVKSVDRLR